MISNVSRRLVAALLPTILFLVGCSTLSLKSRDFGADDWTIAGADGARRSTIDAPLDPPLELIWEFNVGAGTGPGSVLVVDEVVLVGTRKGHVFAIDSENGKRIGRVKVDAPVEGGMAITDRMLLVPGAKRKAAAFGLDLDRGKVSWKLAGEPVEAGVLVVDSLLVLAGSDALLRVVDSRSGEEVWHHAFDSTASVVASPASRGSVAYVADEKGVLYAVDVGRERELWRQVLYSPVYQSLTLGSELLYVPTTRGRLFGVEATTGDVRWTLALPDTTVRFSPASYDVVDQLLIVGGTDGFVRALNAETGAVLWETQIDSPVSAAPLMTRHTVYAGSLGRKLVGLDRNTGIKLWEYETPGRIYSAPAATADLLIVLSEPQKVLAFRVPETPTSEPTP